MASLLKFKIKKGKGELRLQYFFYPLCHLIYINGLLQLIDLFVVVSIAEYKILCPGGEGFRPNPITVILEGNSVSLILKCAPLELPRFYLQCCRCRFDRYRWVPGAPRAVPRREMYQHLWQFPVPLSDGLLPEWRHPSVWWYVALLGWQVLSDIKNWPRKTAYS